MMNEEDSKLCEDLRIKTEPYYSDILNSKDLSNGYKIGYEDGYNHLKNALYQILEERINIPKISECRVPIPLRSADYLIQEILKMHGKVDAFYRIAETSDDMDGLYSLICEDLENIRYQLQQGLE